VLAATRGLSQQPRWQKPRRPNRSTKRKVKATTGMCGRKWRTSEVAKRPPPGQSQPQNALRRKMPERKIDASTTTLKLITPSFRLMIGGAGER
jgi:hypothetical protein